MIQETGGKYFLYSKDGEKLLGEFDTLEQAEEREREVKQMTAITKGGSGLIVMLHLSVDDAIKIAPAEGESVEMLHITLAYMGNDMPVGAFDAVTRAVESVCCEAQPISGLINGVGRFNASDSSDGMDVVYASFDCPELSAFREKIVCAIESQLVPVKKNHGYIPHVTLKYVYPFDTNPLPVVQTTALKFDTVTVAMAGETRHIKLGSKYDPAIDTTSEAERLAHSDVPGSIVSEMPRLDESRMLALRLLGVQVIEKSDEESEPVPCRVLKMDDARRLVYGVVLSPYEVDTQNHVMTAEDVEYAAHHFLGSNGVMAVRHRQFADAVCVESYIAPCDFELNGTLVKTGDWVLVSYVRDDQLWNKIVNGEYQGYSVGGFGELSNVK